MFKGKKVLVLGVANERSIAWSIAEALHREGAELAFTYVGEALEKRVRPLAGKIGSSLVLPCNVQSDEEIEALFRSIKEQWGSLDAVVHSVAFAEREELQGRFSATSRHGFHSAMDVSVYSLIRIASAAEPLMSAGGSILTLTYLGARRVVPHYNVMGLAKAALETAVRYLAADLGPANIRVNAISAGPVKTLAASAIPEFKDLLTVFAERAPLRRNVTLEDIAGGALYLLGPLASGVTGEVTYVDCGFNIMGV